MVNSTLNQGSTYNTIWAYPWDLHDDGIDVCIRYLREDVGLDAVSVAAAYHTFQQLRPQRPGAKLLVSNEAAVYFQPDQELYRGTAIEPNVAALAQQSNPLAELGSSCSKHGLDLIAWTVCLHNSDVAARYPQFAQQTAYGDNLGWIPCPGEDDVRAYVVALCTDLVHNYGVKRLELEMCNFGAYGHTHHHPKDGMVLGSIGHYLYSLSFSAGCMAKAADRGIDAQGLRRWVRDQLDGVFASGCALEGDVEMYVGEHAELAAFQGLREDLVASLVAQIKAAAGAAEAEVAFMLMGDRWVSAVDREKIARHADFLETLAYTNSPESARQQVMGLLPVVPPERLVVGLQAYPPAASSAESLGQVAGAVQECGVRQLSFYNYGIMPRPNLDWIRSYIKK
jgi:hypothetical protein